MIAINQFAISSGSDARNVRTGDVDGDGIDELVVFVSDGNYWGRIQVFKPNIIYTNQGIKTDFIQIGEIFPVNSLEAVRDIDFDKQEEIIVNEDDKESGQPHAAGLRENVTYKWNSNQFTEVNRKKLPVRWTSDEINGMSVADYNESENKMNDTFNRVISKLGDDNQKRELMEQAQEKWVEFRELQVEALRWDRGSIRHSINFGNLTYLTNQRIKTLEQIAHPEEGLFSLSDGYFKGRAR